MVTEISTWLDPRQIELVKESFGKSERFNPRGLSNPGFGPEKMSALREGIKKDGVNHPLLVRVENGKNKLIAGERRLRAVLGLIDEDEDALRKIESGEKVPRVMCWNQRTKKMEPALDAYSDIECKIVTISDEKEYTRQSVQENTLHEPLTDYELLLQCDKLQQAGFTRAEQSDIMGMSEAWISQSHSLLAADEHLLMYMEQGKLSRTAAITFLNVPDDKVRPVLKRAIDLTYKEAEEKENLAIHELDYAKRVLEHREKELQLSQFTGNQESSRKARRNVNKAGRDVLKADDKVKAARAKREQKKITVETINQAAKESNADDNLNSPVLMKQVRLHCADLEDHLAKQSDTIRHRGTRQKYNRREVTIVRGVLAFILGNKEFSHPLDAITKADG